MRGIRTPGKFFVLTGMAAFLALAVFAPSRQASAARFSGAYLLRICGSDAKGREVAPGAHAACQSYISGIIDYHNMLRSMKIAPEINFCIPDSVPLNEIQAVVMHYLLKNSQNDGFVAAPAVLLALYDRYPCRGNSGRRRRTR